MFTRSGTTWTQQQKLLASDGAAGDLFGAVISISGDTALIGAQLDDDNGEDSGSAYVFTRSGTTWTQQQKLLASDRATGDNFGAVYLDGNTAIIGALLDDDKGVDSGSSYVFTRTGNIWTQQQKLVASDGTSGDYFGWPVFSGNTAFISAFYDDDKGSKSGSVYVFTKENNPPNKPTIEGETSGKTGTEYNYTFIATDPDEDEISYYIDWGDNTSTDWTTELPSGEYYNSSHTWTEKGDYEIKAKVRDKYNAESEWETLTVSMPKSKVINIPLFLQKLFQRFPFFEKILNLYYN